MSREHAKLVYLFWHWKQPGIGAERYETTLRAFHSSLAENPPVGFIRSVSSAFTGAPWAAGGGKAYVDRYFIRDSAAIDALDASVASVARHLPHDNIVAMTASGVGGISAVRFGEPLTEPRFAYWFAKPRGAPYPDVFRTAEALTAEHGAVCYTRRMALGPSPEFCVESAAAIHYPDLLRDPPLALRTVWPLV